MAWSGRRCVANGAAGHLGFRADPGDRLSGMFFPGSVLLLPSGPMAWAPSSASDLTFADFAPALAEKAEFEVLLLGLGPRFQPLAKDLRQALMAAGLPFDLMDTGAA